MSTSPPPADDHQHHANGSGTTSTTSHGWSHTLMQRARQSAEDPYRDFGFWRDGQVADERVSVHSYDPMADSWSASTHTVRMERTPFAKGSMRTCYRMKKLSAFMQRPTWESASAYVAKRYTQSTDEHSHRQLVMMDVRVQMMAKHYAEVYNEQQPPKKIDVMQTIMITCHERPGEPTFCVERFLSGHYIKYNSNMGFTDDHRNTPHAFSHFTFEQSQGQHLVVDIQGVGDIYTDPQIHSVDELDFGEGNLGWTGYALFFHTHECNSICRHLDLKPFEHYPYKTTLSELERRDLRDPAKAKVFEKVDSVTKTKWRATSKVARLHNANGVHAALLAPSSIVSANNQGVLPKNQVSLHVALAHVRAAMHYLPSSEHPPAQQTIDLLITLADKWQTFLGTSSILDTVPSVKITQPSPPRQQSLPATMQLHAVSSASTDSSMPLATPSKAPKLPMRTILGLVHRKIARLFMMQDLPFKVPASASEIPAIVLFHYHQASEHDCVDAQLVLANVYAGLPCQELSEAPWLTDGREMTIKPDIILSTVYAEKAAALGSRVGWLKVALVFDTLNCPVPTRPNPYSPSGAPGDKSTYEERYRVAHEQLPGWPDRYQRAAAAYERAIVYHAWTNHDMQSGSYELTLEQHTLFAHLARLMETGGYGLSKDVNRAYVLWMQAAEMAEVVSKAKTALVYYERAAQLGVE